ncbi:hypothetical protein RvY_11511-1 [Ramazzottius varieornatus]|uniref:Sulfatase N-terminal domain-containing protein n=1 Tax=Ramazzottius varieornatus TaxID=947166 RepID=A0A1D1VIF4_RAMVA|nr:hypothetical protein RvY_11511-1 [Ramazzottius varieornatus]
MITFSGLSFGLVQRRCMTVHGASTCGLGCLRWDKIPVHVLFYLTSFGLGLVLLRAFLINAALLFHSSAVLVWSVSSRSLPGPSAWSDEERLVSPSRSSSRPNIVITMADDLGRNDVSFHGHSDISTPNIDGLAQESIKHCVSSAFSSICLISHVMPPVAAETSNLHKKVSTASLISHIGVAGMTQVPLIAVLTYLPIDKPWLLVTVEKCREWSVFYVDFSGAASTLGAERCFRHCCTTSRTKACLGQDSVGLPVR